MKVHPLFFPVVGGSLVGIGAGYLEPVVRERIMIGFFAALIFTAWVLIWQAKRLATSGRALLNNQLPEATARLVESYLWRAAQIDGRVAKTDGAVMLLQEIASAVRSVQKRAKP